MTEDRIGTALRALVPEPPAELTMTRLTAARAVHRRRRALVATVAVLAVLAVVLPVTVLSVRLATLPAATAPDTPVTSTVAGVTVTHPASWRHQVTENEAQLREGYLSTARLDPDTCDARGCGRPAADLGRDGVLVSIGTDATLDVTLDEFPGTPDVLGGHPARRSAGPVLSCRIPAARAHPRIYLQLADAAGRPVVVLIDACLAGPDLDRTGRQLTELAAGVRLDQ